MTTMHRTADRQMSDLPMGGDGDVKFDELIYSRTDPRGVIRSCNHVFQRLCGMPMDQLVGAPHRVIRHADMPKGFFHIFWGLLKQGAPAVGYVKNRRADGGHYWVLAAAIPCEGGYFSVRMRPSSPVFASMQKEYTTLLAEEAAEGLSPEVSAQRLTARLAQHGFASYDAFAAHAMAAEIRSRDEQLARPPDDQAAALSSLLSVLTDTLAEQTRLMAQFADLVLLPVNMRLVAARLEPQGGPISQISVNYKTSSEEIARRLSGFMSGKGDICGQMARAVRRSLIQTACARLQGELVEFYDRTDTGTSGTERLTERNFLQDVMMSCMASADASLNEAASMAHTLNEASVELRRMILGLDTIRILARVESRKSAESQAALTATIDRIDVVQGGISNSLKVMTERTAAIDHGLSQLRRGDARAAVAAA